MPRSNRGTPQTDWGTTLRPSNPPAGYPEERGGGGHRAIFEKENSPPPPDPPPPLRPGPPQCMHGLCQVAQQCETRFVWCAMDVVQCSDRAVDKLVPVQILEKKASGEGNDEEWMYQVVKDDEGQEGAIRADVNRFFIAVRHGKMAEARTIKGKVEAMALPQGVDRERLERRLVDGLARLSTMARFEA